MTNVIEIHQFLWPHNQHRAAHPTTQTTSNNPSTTPLAPAPGEFCAVRARYHSMQVHTAPTLAPAGLWSVWWCASIQRVHSRCWYHFALALVTLVVSVALCNARVYSSPLHPTRMLMFSSHLWLLRSCLVSRFHHLKPHRDCCWYVPCTTPPHTHSLAACA